MIGELKVRGFDQRELFWGSNAAQHWFARSLRAAQ